MSRTHIPAKPRRFVFLHHHIMKNAGSTIAGVLAREFGGGFHDMDSDHADGEFTSDELIEYLLANPSIEALSSHQIRFPQIDHPTLIAFECCIIRHPTDRLHSLYRYLRGKDTGLPIGRVARENDVRGFVQHLLERQPHLICNVQTMLLANGGRFTRPPDPEDLQRAIGVIRKISVPGVVNQLDEAMVVAEYFLNPVYPGMQLHYSPENVTKAIRIPLPERERQFRSACGESIYAQVRRMQELDFALFEAAEEEVCRRADLIPGFNERLTAFQSRMSKRYGTAAA